MLGRVTGKEANKPTDSDGGRSRRLEWLHHLICETLIATCSFLAPNACRNGVLRHFACVTKELRRCGERQHAMVVTMIAMWVMQTAID